MSESEISASASPASPQNVRQIAERFDIPGPFEVREFPFTGNIHRLTYRITAGDRGDKREYLLQMLNTEVFADPAAMMRSWVACIDAQRKAIAEGALPENATWEPIRRIPTRQGAAYLSTGDDAHPRCWRMMARIRNARSYKDLSEIPESGKRERVAEETGKGLAWFRVLTAGMNTDALTDPLPGYRNTALYYAQLESVLGGARTEAEAAPFLPADHSLREAVARHFLVRLPWGEFRSRVRNPQVRRLAALAMDHKSHAMKLQRGLENGLLAPSLAHGDTKLDNFLFEPRTSRVRSLVDLDTVMRHTWLSDWGDTVRSLVNISGERPGTGEPVRVHMPVFKALARGFLGASPRPSRLERALMADAGGIMALELGVRFLADYVRGDTYFSPETGGDPELNRIRAAVQFSLFERLRDSAAEIEQCIETLIKKDA